MRITLDVPAQQIAYLMTSAIESGDPVTSARKGGWCWGIYYRTYGTEPPPGNWYFDQPDLYEAENFQIEVIEVADESAFQWFDDDGSKVDGFFGDFDVTTTKNLESGALKRHSIRRKQLCAGLAVMARKFPERFGEVMDGDTDAPCADIFLQCVCFGEEKYA